LALAAALLYGTADFLGGVASRRARVFAVLAVTAPAGATVMVAVALVVTALSHLGLGGSDFATLASGGWSGLGWGIAAGSCGALGLIAFYAGFAAAPMSVVAPVAALVSTVLPVGVAVAGGERPGYPVVVGALICMGAVVLVSLERRESSGTAPGQASGGHITGGHITGGRAAGGRAAGGRAAGERAAGERVAAGSSRSPRLVGGRMRGLVYGAASGAAFGLFFLFLKNAGTTAVLWPVASARLAGTAVAIIAVCLTRTGPPWRIADRGVLRIAIISGAIDAVANIFYILATRAGLFGLAVVITALYPGVTVLLARLFLGERMRGLQRAGLVLAALGIALVTI
jgi:drug/metabolite transporter (DMT)-like permease